MIKLVNQHYQIFTMEAMVMAQGDISKADYILDCNWYEYFYRKKTYTEYTEMVNAELNSRKGK